MAIIKLLTILGIALLLIRLKYELWIVLLISSLATALLYGLGSRALVTSFFRGAIGLPTIRLILAVYLITTLGEVLKTQGYFTRLIGALETAVRDARFVLAIPPILLGLLPMPAGAMMSAPIVGEVGEKSGLSAEEKTFINFWFRHIWEYAWPLYPGVILASTLIVVPIESVVRSQLPLVLIAAVLGFGYIFFRVSGRRSPVRAGGGRGLQSFFISIWPILVIIVLVLFLKVGLIISLSSVLVAVFLLHRMSARSVISCLKRGAVPKTFLLLLSVMIFRQVLEASGGVGAFSELPAGGEMTGLLAFCAVPFIVGLLTGVTVAFVGVAIPIFLHLLQGNLNMLFLLYVCGFAGVLLSPTHLCLVVTRDYFGADFLRVYRRLLPLAGALMALGFLISYLRGLGL
jgi:integral membrane protein (TIGR00529 family)